MSWDDDVKNIWMDAEGAGRHLRIHGFEPVPYCWRAPEHLM